MGIYGLGIIFARRSARPWALPGRVRELAADLLHQPPVGCWGAIAGMPPAEDRTQLEAADGLVGLPHPSRSAVRAAARVPEGQPGADRLPGDDLLTAGVLSLALSW